MMMMMMMLGVACKAEMKQSCLKPRKKKKKVIYRSTEIVKHECCFHFTLSLQLISSHLIFI